MIETIITAITILAKLFMCFAVVGSVPMAVMVLMMFGANDEANIPKTIGRH